MDKFQRTSFTPRNELLTTPRWLNTLSIPGGGLDGDLNKSFDMDMFDKVEKRVAFF